MKQWILGLKVLLVVCVTMLLVLSIAGIAAAEVKGADVSWLPQMEANGYKFYNASGVQKDCLDILKEYGISAIRLRTWVNPSADKANGHCSASETASMANRCRNKGFQIMLDFHYSDSWADPGKQYKPAAWASLDFNGLMKKVYDYSKATQQQVGSTTWTQIGNETNNGMLWETGKASVNPKNYAWLINCGYDGSKAGGAQKCIVHVSNGYDNALFRWNFDIIKNNGGKWDMIGMSLYPSTSDWSSKCDQMRNNISDMKSRYGKPVMIVEVGLDYTAATATRDFIKKARTLGADGVFYWEPECYNWAGYTKGAWGTNGRPTVAMDGFK
ncbi:MAG TPA: glycosyl hydrolase 53 family protein [Bacillota bacterium]|nr:glycosyl hydrolase 53 family protein [Bacillota bacterium]